MSLTRNCAAAPTCQQPRTKIGTEITYTIEHLPASFVRIKHVQYKYACATCEHDGHNPQITLAAKTQASPIDKRLPGPGLWIYLGDDAHPYNVFDLTVGRARDGPAQFLKDFRQTLLADAYGGYDGIVVNQDLARAGCWGPCAAEVRRGGARRTPGGPHDPCASPRTCSSLNAGVVVWRPTNGCASGRPNLCRCWKSSARCWSSRRPRCCPSIHWPRRSATR